MSLFREFRPLVRMLDDPFFSPPSRQHQHYFDQAFFRQPAVSFCEDGNHYIVEAEVPGVKKENLSLTIGEGGKSLTIEGRAEERMATATKQNDKQPEQQQQQQQQQQGQSTEVAKTSDEDRQVAQSSGMEQFVRDMSFSRTVWLPKPVDPNSVSAKLEHGVLRVELTKAADKQSVKVNIQ